MEKSLEVHLRTIIGYQANPPLLDALSGKEERQLGSVHYEPFVRRWITDPLVDALKSAVGALRYDLKELRKSTGGEASLDENYLMLNDLLMKVNGLRVDVDVLRRKEVRLNRQTTLMRSKMLKLWRTSHKLVREQWRKSTVATS